MGFKFNPFDGSLDLVKSDSAVTNTEFAQKVAEEFACTAATVVGDLVVASTTLAETVEPITTNVYANLVFGIVIEKLSITQCKVLISGKLSGAGFGLSGLTFGKPLYVGPTGTLVTTVPTSGHRQRMGIAVKSDTIFLLPSMEKVVRA